jgi:hypothetical protein
MPDLQREVLRVVSEVRELLSDPERWTQESYARDAEGRPTYIIKPWSLDNENDPGPPFGPPVCFCLDGAVRRVTGYEPVEVEVNDRSEALYNGVHKLLENVTRDKTRKASYSEFNDTATHDELMALLDEALETAGRQAR